jgi:glycosyltransferase involved in cell wall biosynthesis
VSDAAGGGGAEVQLALLAGELADEYEFVALIGEQMGEMARDRLASAGVRIVCIPGLARIPRAGALRRLTGALRALHPAVVHVNATDQGDGLSAILAARALRLPLLVSVHVALLGRSARHELLSARTLRAADAVIAVSDGIAAHLATLRVDATVVPNGVPVPVAEAGARQALGVDAGACVVGGIGRLTEQKGWDVLCRAMPALRAQRPDVVVVVIGDGPQRSELESLAREHDVRLLGARENAASLLTGFDVLAAPSRYEGLALVPMEALHAGVPVVASDIDGLRDVVGDAGVLVTPEDPDALGAALATLAADRAARAELAERGRERAAQRFTVPRMAHETAAVYTRLIDADPPVQTAPSVTMHA